MVLLSSDSDLLPRAQRQVVPEVFVAKDEGSLEVVSKTEKELRT